MTDATIKCDGDNHVAKFLDAITQIVEGKIPVVKDMDVILYAVRKAQDTPDYVFPDVLIRNFWKNLAFPIMYGNMVKIAPRDMDLMNPSQMSDLLQQTDLERYPFPCLPPSPKIEVH